MVVAQGALNKEAAAQLFLNPKTIAFHLHNAYLATGNRAKTARLAPSS